MSHFIHDLFDFCSKKYTLDLLKRKPNVLWTLILQYLKNVEDIPITLPEDSKNALPYILWDHSYFLFYNEILSLVYFRKPST